MKQAIIITESILIKCVIRVIGSEAVMAENKYAVLLKNILRYAHIKYGALADALGYDISYISKWINGIRLPTAKNIDSLNQNIAHYVANILIKNHMVDGFTKNFMLDCCNAKDELSSEIYRLLISAYHQTIRSSTEKKSRNDAPPPSRYWSI